MIRRVAPGAPAADRNPTPTAPGSAPKERMAWLDVAKGVCILLVVLHHITSKYVMVVLPPELIWVAEEWRELNRALKPLRMPVFFVISGFFAAGAIQRPWRQVTRRVTSPYYLYVVWSLIYVVIYRIETEMEANRTTSAGEFLGELYWSSTSAWFLFALAAYFVVAKVCRRVPPLLVVGAAFGLSAATGWMDIEYTNRVSVLSHLVFFLIGAYFPGLVRWCGGLSSQVLAGMTTSYVAVFVLTGFAGLPSSSTLAMASLLGVPLGLAAARRLGEIDWLAGPLGWLGRRTLRVYVLHFGVLALVFDLPFAIHTTGLGGALFAAVLPLLVTAAITGLCLLAHDLLQRAGGTFLFALPARWTAVRPLSAARSASGR